MNEVKNEWLEVVAWISADGTHAEASTKSTVYGSHTIPLCRHSEALAGYAVRDARIAELEAKYQRDVYGLNNEGDSIGGEPAGGYANDNSRLRAELAAIKAQEPVAWMLKNEKGRIEEILPYMPCASDMQPYWPEPFPLYAAPVAKQVVMPDDDELMQMAFEIGEPCEDATGYWFSMEDWEKFTIELRTRLNAAYQEGGQDE